MTDIAFYDETEEHLRTGYGLRAWFRLRRIRRPVQVADLRRTDVNQPSYLLRWADLYVRHGL